MLKPADASQMPPLLILIVTTSEQIDSSLLQMEGCDAHYQRQLASNGVAGIRFVHVDLAQLDQRLKAWTQVWVCSWTCRQQDTQLSRQCFGTGAVLQRHCSKDEQVQMRGLYG